MQTMQGMKTTSWAKLIPLSDIPHESWPIPDDIYDKRCVPCNAGQSEKGRAAEGVVLDMLELMGRKPLEITDRDQQLSGIDIVVSDVSYQVKCDWNGGDKELGGTGNLYIELNECNPQGKH